MRNAAKSICINSLVETEGDLNSRDNEFNILIKNIRRIPPPGLSHRRVWWVLFFFFLISRIHYTQSLSMGAPHH